jgi:hypothetical protein
MNKKAMYIVGGVGCGLLILLLAIGAVALLFLPFPLQRFAQSEPEPERTPEPTWTPALPGPLHSASPRRFRLTRRSTPAIRGDRCSTWPER